VRLTRPAADSNKSTAEERVDSGALDRAALHGAVWVSATKPLTQAVSWVVTILVARLLTPHDYGLTTMAGAFLGLVSVLGEFGIGTTILTRRHLQSHQINALNSVSIALGVASVIVCTLCAWPLGRFFRSTELPLVIVALSTTFLIDSAQVVPAAMLRRELAFRRLALIDMLRGGIVPCASLALALMGLGYWALVCAAILGAGISTVATLRYRHLGFEMPVWDELREELIFTRDILVSRVAFVFYSESDFAVAGRRLGATPLGAYSLAWTLANNPIEKVTQLLSNVVPAVFGAAQRDRTALRRYFLNSTELLAFVTLPLSLGMCVVSRDFVDVALGARWSAAATPLALLAGYAGFRSLLALNGHLFPVIPSQLRFGMWLTVGSAATLPIAFLIGSRWGPTGIAAAWLAVHPVFGFVALRRVQRELELSMSEYIGCVRLGLDGSVAMVVAVLASQVWINGFAPLAKLMLEVGVGAATFLLVTVLLHRDRLLAIRAWLIKTHRDDAGGRLRADDTRLEHVARGD